MKPLVSVIIPLFNNAEFLPKALEGVMKQTYHPLEIIVVDDGSTDDPQAAAASFADNVLWFQQPNAGNAAARNTGLSQATADFIAFLDADDHWIDPEKTTRQMALFDVRPELDIVFAGMSNFDDESGVESARPAIPGVAPGTAVIRRSVFDRVGLFREDLRVGVFIEWYMRARDAGIVQHVLEDVVLARRVHGENVTLRTSDRNHVYATLLKAKIDLSRKKKAAR